MPSASISGILPQDVAVHDDLLALQVRDYEQVRSRFVDKMMGRPGILLICQYGSFRAPGVSDIDLFVVAEDAAYGAVVRAAEDAIRSIPDGAYFFTHQAFVLPRSLLPQKNILFFEHLFDPCVPIAGDAALLRCVVSPAIPVIAVTSALWASTIWPLVWRRSGSLRQLLHLLQTITRQTALETLLLDGRAACDPVLERGRQLRSLILSVPDRTEAMRAGLREALDFWEETHFRMQSWWMPGERAEGAVTLFGRTISFRDVPDPVADGIVLPAFHADLLTFLRSAFAPHLELGIAVVPRSRRTEISAAMETYREAVEIAKQWCGRFGHDPFALFLHGGRGIFPSPFNLARPAPFDFAQSLRKHEG
ncbi:MAG: hypothetical protein V1926_03255 [Candidatus Peregrinibacteria bacterium]